jgi:hypothetical protein
MRALALLSAASIAAVVFCGDAQSQDGGGTKPGTNGAGTSGAKTFEGLNFGVGLALIFPFDRKGGASVDAEVDGTGVVRITRESKRTPAVLLESHYLFKQQTSSIVGTGTNQSKSGLWFCPVGNTCSHGPFVAIQASSEAGSTISAYGLGWMLAFKRNDIVTDSSSWNIGLGYVVRTGVQKLGDGLEANKPMPQGDKVRYKSISQPGWMWMTSFSF